MTSVTNAGQSRGAVTSGEGAALLAAARRSWDGLQSRAVVALPWALIAGLWWAWVLAPFAGVGMATQDQIQFSLHGTGNFWRGVLDYARGQGRVYFLLNKIVELWIAARPEQTLRQVVNLASFALAPCFFAYAALQERVQRLLYLWLFWSLAWIGYHHLPPAAYPTVNHWPFALWALGAAWVSHRDRRPNGSRALSAGVFGVIAFIALFQYEAITMMSLGMLGWVVSTRARGPLRRALWLALGLALLAYAASYLGWRGLYPSKYDGAQVGAFSAAGVLRVTLALALGALPFGAAFSYGTPLRWGDRVVGESVIGFDLPARTLPDALGILLTLAALVCIARIYAKHSSASASSTPWRWLWVLIGFLVIGLNAPLGLTTKYQRWISNYSDAYITSQLTSYALALAGVAVLDVLWRRARVRGLPLAFAGALLAVAALSLPIQVHNQRLGARQRGNMARWEEAALLAKAEAYTAGGELVAPDLFYGVFANEPDWGRYWSRYVRQRFGRSMTFHALPARDRPELPLARLHRFEDGRLRALTIQYPESLIVLAHRDEAPAEVFWAIGKGAPLDWSRADVLGKTGYSALSLTSPWALTGTDRVLELVWSTPEPGVFPEPEQAQVTASAEYSRLYVAQRAFDTQPGTEWLLPDGVDGWVELEFPAPRRIREVQLTNAINLPHRDRATLAFHIDVLDGEGRLLGSVQGSFPAIESNEPEQDVQIEAENVSRLRVYVDSHQGLGGGLAEIAVR